MFRIDIYIGYQTGTAVTYRRHTGEKYLVSDVTAGSQSESGTEVARLVTLRDDSRLYDYKSVTQIKTFPATTNLAPLVVATECDWKDNFNYLNTFFGGSLVIFRTIKK